MDSLTEQMLRNLEEKLRNSPHINTPFGTVFGASSEQEVEAMDERINLYNELLRKREREQDLEELYRVYYKVVEAWYRWLVADAHASVINPRPKPTGIERLYRAEPEYLRRYVARKCEPKDLTERGLVGFIGIHCPWQDFGSSEIPAAKVLGWDKEARAHYQRFRNMAWSKDSPLSATP